MKQYSPIEGCDLKSLNKYLLLCHKYDKAKDRLNELIKANRKLLDFYRPDLQERVFYSNHELFENCLTNKVAHVKQVLTQANYDDKKVNRLLSIRERRIDKLLEEDINMGHIGTIINLLEDFHHNVLIDVIRHIEDKESLLEFYDRINVSWI